MGSAKHAWIEHQESLSAATHYLVRVGKLKQCKHHDEVYGGGWDELDNEFYRFAMAERNKGAEGKVPWAADMEAREFTDLLKQAYDDHCGDDCGWCAKNAEE